jgi:hypothetical protein
MRALNEWCRATELIPLGRTVDDYLSLLDGHRDDIEVLTGAGAIDAQACVGLIGGSMGEADEVPFVVGEKLVVSPIERDRDMATTVAIRIKSPLEVDHKTIDHGAPAAQLEFSGGTLGDVARLGND